MEILIRFIGIVTLACLGDDPSDACAGNIAMRAYLPDARKGAIMCKTPIHPHQAYIRISQPHSAMNWTPESCEPNDSNECSLYALDGDELFIKEISRGNGVVYSDRPPGISWRTYYPHIRLEKAIAESRSVAYIDLNSGSLSMEERKLMWVGHLTVKDTSQRDVVIEARGRNGIPTKSITVTSAANITIDIINLPEMIAKDHPIEKGGKKYPPAKEHFYLHYLLASNPPGEKCVGLEPLPARNAGSAFLRAPEISCSNSGYP